MGQAIDLLGRRRARSLRAEVQACLHLARQTQQEDEAQNLLDEALRLEFRAQLMDPCPWRPAGESHARPVRDCDPLVAQA